MRISKALAGVALSSIVGFAGAAERTVSVSVSNVRATTNVGNVFSLPTEVVYLIAADGNYLYGNNGTAPLAVVTSAAIADASVSVGFDGEVFSVTSFASGTGWAQALAEAIWQFEPDPNTTITVTADVTVGAEGDAVGSAPSLCLAEVCQRFTSAQAGLSTFSYSDTFTNGPFGDVQVPFIVTIGNDVGSAVSTVPEPSDLPMLSIGLGLVAAARATRQHGRAAQRSSAHPSRCA